MCVCDMPASLPDAMLSVIRERSPYSRFAQLRDLHKRLCNNCCSRCVASGSLHGQLLHALHQDMERL